MDQLLQTHGKLYVRDNATTDTDYPQIIPDSCRASLMRILSFSHVPDSSGADVTHDHLCADFPPA